MPKEVPERSAERIYDAFAGEYRDYSENKRPYIDAVDREIVNYIEGPIGEVLDFGAGDGVRGARLFEQLEASTLIQVDISDAMVTRCQSLGVASRCMNVSGIEWDEFKTKVDLALCLWNVLGHIPTTSQRVETLKLLHTRMKKDAVIAIDVNNRHYEGYGYWSSIGRRVIDAIAPNYSRGDIIFDWEINGVKYPSSGHFFTAAEMKDLLGQAGFIIEKMVAVDYQNGAVSEQLTKGQLLTIAKA